MKYLARVLLTAVVLVTASMSLPARAGEQPSQLLAPSLTWMNRPGDGTLDFDTVGGCVAAADGGAYTLLAHGDGDDIPFGTSMKVVRTSATGATLWSQEVGIAENLTPTGQGIFVDADENVYFAGMLGGSSSSGTLAAGSLTASGQIRWSQLIPNLSRTTIRGAGLDAQRRLHVFADSDGSWRFWTFSTDGTMTGNQSVFYPADNRFTRGAVTYHPDGRVFHAFIGADKLSAELRVYGPNGGLIRLTAIPLQALDVVNVDNLSVAVNAEGVAFVGAAVTFEVGSLRRFGYTLTQVAANGTVAWTSSRPDPGISLAGNFGRGIRAVRSMPDGGCVVAAESFSSEYTSYDIEVSRFGADGTRLWSNRQMGTGGYGIDRPADMEVNAAGEIYVVGWSARNARGDARLVLEVFSPEGKLVWMDRSLVKTGYAESQRVALAPDGGVIFAADVTVPITKKAGKFRVLTRRFGNPTVARGVAKFKLPTKLAFPTIKAVRAVPKLKSFTVTNSSLTEQLVVTIDPLIGSFYAGGTYTLAPREKVQFTILFHSETPGPYTATLSVHTSDPAHPGGSVLLTGTVR